MAAVKLYADVYHIPESVPKHSAVPGAFNYIPRDEMESTMAFQILFARRNESNTAVQQKHVSFLF